MLLHRLPKKEYYLHCNGVFILNPNVSSYMSLLPVTLPLPCTEPPWIFQDMMTSVWINTLCLILQSRQKHGRASNAQRHLPGATTEPKPITTVQRDSQKRKSPLYAPGRSIPRNPWGFLGCGHGGTRCMMTLDNSVSDSLSLSLSLSLCVCVYTV